MKKVLVFGVFDKFHEGHKNFLRQAFAEATVRNAGLVVVVARDEVVKTLKGRAPDWAQDARVEHIRAFDPQALVVLGDSVPSSYTILKAQQPQIICLGYDQVTLRSDLEARMAGGELPRIQIIMLKPHKPELYKSSKIAHGGK